LQIDKNMTWEDSKPRKYLEKSVFEEHWFERGKGTGGKWELWYITVLLLEIIGFIILRFFGLNLISIQ